MTLAQPACSYWGSVWSKKVYPILLEATVVVVVVVVDVVFGNVVVALLIVGHLIIFNVVVTVASASKSFLGPTFFDPQFC